MVAMVDDEREMPLELWYAAGRLDEVALVVALDEVGDRLGVRLRRQRVAVLARPFVSSR